MTVDTENAPAFTAVCADRASRSVVVCEQQDEQLSCLLSFFSAYLSNACQAALKLEILFDEVVTSDLCVMF